ncbi:TPA: hypothetical protein N0F65_006410 [Lagenidium giganteum]|uniref:Uncharacterized protein n=1 Tax=Lagenidium giganteum TaxID=4803 RepID=A0AAV2YZQ3_9STRA|nr:TPA: hypothetical protein N0F65_006410 [Lagenidium giganteum]
MMSLFRSITAFLVSCRLDRGNYSYATGQKSSRCATTTSLAAADASAVGGSNVTR